MKLYIIFTVDIHQIGGNQLFTAGQAQYMESLEGWKVVVLHRGAAVGSCRIKYLDKFLDGGNRIFTLYQPAQFSPVILDKIYQNTLKKVDIDLQDYDEIYIASLNNLTSLWGEYFAKRMNAKMICFDLTEVYRGKGYYYEEYIDFYKFKFYRHELFSMNLQKLFGKHLQIDDYKKYKVFTSPGQPIQDIDNENINHINSEEYNIAYIGRSDKKYVPGIIREVANFANRHNDSKILFIMVGDATARIQMIKRRLLGIPNIHVLLLGDLVPITRELYKKIDVVIAGAGCAVRSAREGVPTITVDAENCLSNGIMGYTCTHEEACFHKAGNEQQRILKSLEDVFFGKNYKKNIFYMPEPKKPEKQYQANLDCFKQAVQKKEYFDVEINGNIEKVGNKEIIDYYLKKQEAEMFVKRWRKHQDKIVVFGTGTKAAQCYNWLKSINEEPEYFVDNDCTKWYTEFCGMDIKPVDTLLQEDNILIIISSHIHKNAMFNQLSNMSVAKDDNVIEYDLIKNY